MKKYKLKKEIMPDSVCGMEFVCTRRTARLVSIANANCEVVCVWGARGSGRAMYVSAVSSPSGVRGGAQAAKRFYHI